MTDTDVDTAHTRRSQQDTESTTVDITGMGSESDHLTSASAGSLNPFQQSQPRHHPQQQHYSIHIPTINHWPTLLIQHTRKGVSLIRKSIQRLRDNSYQSVPSSDDYHNPFHTSGFGGRKEPGHSSSCSGRRLSWVLILLSLLALTVTWVLLPTTLKPFQDRDVWVRFFDHEEPVKIVLPYSRKVHVYDVKKYALKEMDNGYTSHNPDTVKLLAVHSAGLLRTDAVWDNNVYFNSARDPIIAIETGLELFDHLNRTLGCFSDASAFGNDMFKIHFQPKFNDYQPLSNILNGIQYDVPMVHWQIRYLRQAFNDPLKDAEHPDHELWVRPKKDRRPQYWHVHPTYDAQDIPALPWSE
ncbi:hypothetical protein BGZ75_009203 [Mortierella antarctica]|nr:hypothetical protein BGZ75_009203 [Mortierella antarctica]